MMINTRRGRGLWLLRASNDIAEQLLAEGIRGEIAIPRAERMAQVRLLELMGKVVKAHG